MSIHRHYSSTIIIDRQSLIREVFKGYHDYDALKAAIDAAEII